MSHSCNTCHTVDTWCSSGPTGLASSKLAPVVYDWTLQPQRPQPKLRQAFLEGVERYCDHAPGPEAAASEQQAQGQAAAGMLQTLGQVAAGAGQALGPSDGGALQVQGQAADDLLQTQSQAAVSEMWGQGSPAGAGAVGTAAQRQVAEPAGKPMQGCVQQHIPGPVAAAQVLVQQAQQGQQQGRPAAAHADWHSPQQDAGGLQLPAAMLSPASLKGGTHHNSRYGSPLPSREGAAQVEVGRRPSQPQPQHPQHALQSHAWLTAHLNAAFPPGMESTAGPPASTPPSRQPADALAPTGMRPRLQGPAWPEEQGRRTLQGAAGAPATAAAQGLHAEVSPDSHALSHGSHSTGRGWPSGRRQTRRQPAAEQGVQEAAHGKPLRRHEECSGYRLQRHAGQQHALEGGAGCQGAQQTWLARCACHMVQALVFVDTINMMWQQRALHLCRWKPKDAGC